MSHNVICLKQGIKFNADYVNKLFHGVLRNTTLSIKFHCFTDDPTGLDTDIIVHELPQYDISGWWYKLYLLSSDINITGRMLYIDLDTLITGNIDRYIAQDIGFVVLQDLWSKADNVGSALMSFEAGTHSHIWDTFIKNPQGEMRAIHPHGDQKIIQKYQLDRLYWQQMFPNEIVSFKSNNAAMPNNNIKIICFHGIPSIVDAIDQTTQIQGFILKPAPWITDYWKID